MEFKSFTNLNIFLVVFLLFGKTSFSQECDSNGVKCISCTDYQSCNGGIPDGVTVSCKSGVVCADAKLKECQMKLNCYALNECSEAGIFPDAMVDSNFFVCLSDGGTGFLKYEFNCKEDSFFDQSTQSCVSRTVTSPNPDSPSADPNSSSATGPTTTDPTTTAPTTTGPTTTDPTTTDPTTNGPTTTAPTTTGPTTTDPTTIAPTTTDPTTIAPTTNGPTTTDPTTTDPTTTDPTTNGPTTTAPTTTGPTTTDPTTIAPTTTDPTTIAPTTNGPTTTDPTTTDPTTTDPTTTDPTTIAPTTTDPTTPTTPPPTVCPMAGIFPVSENCKMYYRCSTSLKPFYYICPGSSYFNENILKCSLIISPTCQEQILKNSTSTTATTTMSTPKPTTTSTTTTTTTPQPTTTSTTSATTTPEPTTTSTTTATTPKPTTTSITTSATFTCQTFGTFENPSDCKTYYRCSTSGKIFRYVCPGNTYFNEFTKRCSLVITPRCKNLLQGL